MLFFPKSSNPTKTHYTKKPAPKLASYRAITPESVVLIFPNCAYFTFSKPDISLCTTEGWFDAQARKLQFIALDTNKDSAMENLRDATNLHVANSSTLRSFSIPQHRPQRGVRICKLHENEGVAVVDLDIESSPRRLLIK